MKLSAFWRGVRFCNRGMSVALVVIGHVGQEVVRTASAVSRHMGGSALYAAAGARLAGAEVGIVTRVADSSIAKRLAAIGVDLAGVVPADGEDSQFWITYSSDFQDRRVEAALGVCEGLSPSDIPLSYYHSRHFYIATNQPARQLQFLNHLRTIAAATISVECFDGYLSKDPSTVMEVLEHSDLFFASEVEAETIEKHRKLSIPHITRLAAKGALYSSPHYRTQVSAPPVPLVDPTGAGDLFSGVYLGSRARGASIRRSLAYACFRASQKVTGFGLSAFPLTELSAGD
jgi:sugar/nucleoside kinase (ribokinase family)